MCPQFLNSNSSSNKKHFSGIDPVSFYGGIALKQFEDVPKTVLLPESSLEFRNLSSPSTVWKTFRKQQEVLDFVSSTNCDLFPFTYQTDNGDRLFLAAHPIAFWYVDEQRPDKERHSYEIIREFKPCKLYFDLEFDATVNPNRDGHHMVDTFINLVCLALKFEYDITCDVKDVLNFDSTSEKKFSCHLIFPRVIFDNNYSMGYFVKQLCHELKSVLECPKLHLLQNVEMNKAEANSLFVANDKGKRILFCDEGVYTKNRHFRLYKSSKHGRNVALCVSKSNAFPIQGDDPASREKFTFLSSLITFCDTDKSLLLTYESSDMSIVCRRERDSRLRRSCANLYTPSPYSDIDDCINNLVSPGRIYRSTHFSEKQIIVYDIIGNRYCRNVGREHKSNNVMYVVNMSNLTYYQKCYDPDCVNFKSVTQKLPVSEDVFVKYNIDDEVLLAAVEQSESDMNLKGPSSDFIDGASVSAMDSNQRNGSGENENGMNVEVCDDELLVAVTEQCELSACLMEDWDPISS